jgi:hypothetical protein
MYARLDLRPLFYCALFAIAPLEMGRAQNSTLQPITDLFNTGVDNNRAPLPDNSIDPHYAFTQFAGGPPPLSASPIVATASGGFPIGGGPWLADNALSAWITPALDTTGNAGDYTYRTTFTIPAGVDVTQAHLAGVWASDNNGIDIVLNGQSAGYPNAAGFSVYSPQWVIGRGFVTGTNTLDFIVNEATGSAGNGGFTGVRVEMTGAAPVPGRVAIPGLKNSGVAAPEGLPLADDAVDAGVVLTGAVTGPAIVARGSAGFPIPPWAPDNNQSAWVTPAADTNGPDGDYAYTITFDLSGFNSNSVSILGRWAVDNTGTEILLNGQPTGNVNGAGFADYMPFSISSEEGDLFLPGVNTLSFRVNNGAPPGPTGVRWEFLSATVAIPEPGSAGLILMALGFFAGRVARRA